MAQDAIPDLPTVSDEPLVFLEKPDVDVESKVSATSTDVSTSKLSRDIDVVDMVP